MDRTTTTSFEHAPITSTARRIGGRTVAVLHALLALPFVVGGTWLIALGGSPYYLLAGLAYFAGAILLWRGRPLGVGLSVGLFAATLAWALAETGLNFWPLVPRLAVPAGLAMLALLVVPGRRAVRVAGLASAGIFAAALVAMLVAAFQPHGVISPSATPLRFAGAPTATEWRHYGQSAAGTRYAALNQITPANVGTLKLAWTYRTGDTGPGEDQNVPIQVGDTLYSCSRNNHVAAIDADTGRARWTFDAKASSPVWQRCRGVGYHEATTAAVGADCPRRILLATIDARLIAVDAATGQLCRRFGKIGTVDLKLGMGEVKPGFYFSTSAPTVVRNLVVIGGWVRDNQERGEPSGVVRAFDVTSGTLVWAWDLGDPSVTREPHTRSGYSRGTPNMWSTPSFDERLGLLYVPLGNATPDYYGAGRSPQAERHASSVVALDIATGRPRWSFQTTHHDLWDYDVPSQPALIDLPDGKGGVVPALLQTTKRGQLFLLNRATGAPLSRVVEKPVPQQGQIDSEWLAKTQPYSVDLPAIGAERLTEARMWGMTALDQLWCRIDYRRLRYDGDFTPPGRTASLEWPGNYGGMNWGSVSLDPRSGLVFMNDIRLPVKVQLRPRDEVMRIIAHTKGTGNRHGPAPQRGTPFGVTVYPMLSPLGVPCVEPPFGTISAVDLKTRRLAWQVPVGTPRDTGPLGIATHLDLPIGMPTIGGTVATASGLIFHAGTQDFSIRALSAADGRELWRYRLPVGSDSTPMSFRSPKTGKQYVVISAGGVTGSAARGDYVMAFALP